MLIQLFQLVVVGWLPGAVIYRLPVADRPTRAALDAEERFFWAVVLSLTVSLAIVLGLAALHRYSFERLLIADLAIAGVAAAASRFNLRLGPTARKPGIGVLIPVALVALGLWRFFPPSEYVIGGKDPGVYLNEGIQIAQRGTFIFRDPVVASVPAFARDLFIPAHERTDYYSLRFMGFWVKDPDTGAVIGQFPHLFPASIAIGYGVDGLTGARRTAGVWALLGLLAVYFTAVRLAGRTVGAATAALLALHAVQIWFARYPNAEVVMQALLWSAVLATGRFAVDGDRFFAPIAGGLLGLLLFLRIDAVLGIAGVLAGVALLVLTGRRPALGWFLLTLGGVGTLAAVYLLGPMRAYLYLPIVFVTHLSPLHYAALVIAAILAVGGMIVGSRVSGLSARVRRLAPGILAGLLIAAAIYALWFRHPAGRLAAHDAYALRTFTNYYLTLPALIAALLGVAVVARRAFWHGPSVFTTVALFSFFLFYKIRIVPEHFWMARRFLPVILPGALLFAAAAAFVGAQSGSTRTRLLRGGLGLAFITLLGVQYARVSKPLLAHVEYAGVIPKLEQLASQIGDDDLLIVESRDAGTDVHTLALPLAYVYARHVLLLSSRLPDKGDFAAFLDVTRLQYARVLFLGSGGTDLLSRRWGVRVLSAETFQVPEYDTPEDRYPRFARGKQFDYTVYEFTAPANTTPDDELEIDVGERDDLNVLRFHAKESTEGRTFRWSRDVSYVILPRLSADIQLVRFTMNDGGRPTAAPPADVSVALGETALGTVRVDTGFHTYTFQIPAALAQRAAGTEEPVRLTITSTTWSPERLIGTPDDRELGVMIDRISLK